MIEGLKVVVVLPAYNAGSTLERTWNEIPRPLVDDVVLVDDASHDDTIEVAERLGIAHVIRHPRNAGYGANQKTCYREALRLGADIVVMLHPDYQYTPRLIPAMASIIASGLYPVVLGSRILGNGALKGGMPLYKYLANRVLTGFQNLCTGAKLSEYHTGYRAFSAEVLRSVPLDNNADGFLFDNQMLVQIIQAG
jgi:glycosyltransferase involved in cell wall biosynthesis